MVDGRIEKYYKKYAFLNNLYKRYDRTVNDVLTEMIAKMEEHLY